ncbi:hypothetical protein HDU67_003027 [Dinochytrium kinnereticum]|nr:hypothetical protein HDU67_003027 [Dinochytrium kinnereticum]
MTDAWGSFSNRQDSHEVAFQHLLNKLGTLIERRKIVLDEKKRLTELEAAETEKRHLEIMAGPGAGTIDDRILKLENTALYEEKQPINSVHSLDDIEISFLDIILKAVETGISIPSDPLPAEPPTKRSITLQDIVNSAKDEGRLHVAPDGEIPNSVLFRLISEWKSTHNGYEGFEVALRKNVKKQERPGSAKEDERKKKSDAYKARLKLMIEEIEKEKEKPDPPTAEEGAIIEDKAEIQEDSDEDGPILDHEHRRRLPNGPSLLVKPVMLEPRKDFKYPKIVEQAIVYSWFPQEEIFYPSTPSNTNAPHAKSGAKRELKKLRVEANGDNIMPIVLECFRNATSASNRIEMVEYLNWIFEEFGFRDTTSSTRLFCRYLQANLRIALMESLAKYGSLQTEAIPTLVMQEFCSNLKIREKAREILGILGATKADSKFFREAIQDYSTEAEKCFRIESLSASAADQRSKQMTSPAILEFRNTLVAWLRKHLKKYLVKICKDPEAVKKLKELSDNGRVDRGKKTEAADKDDDVDKDDDGDIKPRLSTQKQEISSSQKGRPGRRASIAPGRMSRRSSVACNPAARESLKPTESIRFIALAENIVEAPPQPALIEEDATGVKQAVDHRPVSSEYPPEADPLCGRNPVLILQNPTAQDFAAAINFYVIVIEKKLAKEEQDRLDKIARESKAAEEARLEHERQLALIEFMKKKEIERQARIAQRKERIAELRATKKNDALPRIKRVKSAKLFTGCTHQSTCHPSRETLDIALHKFPPLYTGLAYKGYRGAMSLHFQRLNKSMPVENITLLPFEESDFHESPNNSRLGSANSPLTTGGTKTFFVATSEGGHIEESQTVSDIDYIRKGPGGHFMTQRKYFVHDMTAPA